jgi:uncharacterized protein (TIRG00374 family)
VSAGRALRQVVGFLLAGLFVWLIFAQIDYGQLKRTFAATEPAWLGAALLAFGLDYACRIERWRQLLAPDNPRLRWAQCAGPLLASFAANNVLPFRAGDLIRAFAFNARLGLTSGVVIATLFVERLLDLLMLLLLLGVALTVFGIGFSRFSGAGSVTVIGGVVIMLVLLLPDLFAPIVIALGKWVERVAPKPGRKMLDEIDKSLGTLRHLARGGTMLKLIAWSLLVWLAEGCVFWCAAAAVPALDNALAAWLALPVATLATLIPSTPGYVGTFDYFTIQAMAALGNSPLAATAYALLVHALLWLPATMLGGLYLLLHPARRRAH